MEQLPETLSLDMRVNISVLSAASVALLTKQDVNAAGLASTNAIQNNFCEPPLSKEELERQCEAIKSVVKDVTAEIPGCLSFRGDMHARVEDGFDFIQNFIQDVPFLETLRSFYESNPRASRMLPLPIQGMIYSKSISHLGVDLITPVTILDISLSLPLVTKGPGMVVKGVGLGWGKGTQFVSNAWSRVVQSGSLPTAMDLFQSVRKVVSPSRSIAPKGQITGSATSNAMKIQRGKDGKVKGMTYTQNHHVIHEKLKDHDLWKLSGRNVQERSNIMTLPTKKGAELSATEKTIHQGRHTNASRTRLEEKMDTAEKKGKLEGWTQEQYSQELDKIIKEERIALRKGDRILNKNHRPDATDK